MEPSTELQTILHAYRYPSPFGKEGPNEMETLALVAYSPGTKFKHVVVNMRGVNGNTVVIVGTVMKALALAGATQIEVYLFKLNALSNNYEHALATVLDWVTVTDKEIKPTTDAWTAMVEIAGRNKKPSGARKITGNLPSPFEREG